MDENTKRQVCELIAGMLHADDELHPDEATFFKRVLKRFGLPEDTEIRPITDHAAVVRKLAALPTDSKGETLDLLVIAAAADGQIVPAERIFLGVVADELGIDQDVLDEKVHDALAL